MVDLSKFLPAYFEESEERLVLLESGLCQLAVVKDAGVLEQTIRAVHSIKGSSGTFGFDEVCELAWAIEDVLRHAGNGQLALEAEKIELCVEATNLLREAIGKHRDKEELPIEFMQCLAGRLKAAVTV
jgi:two-component system, chemotaxis family, sensor kinase CheA